MSTRSWSVSDDLGPAALVAVGVVVVMWLVVLGVELRRRERFGRSIAVTGVFAAVLLAAAITRPVRVTTKGSMVGPRVIVLVDHSRRLLLPADAAGTRRGRALGAVREISEHFREARLSVLSFGEGAPRPLGLDASSERGPSLSVQSDLDAALAELGQLAGERPQAIVVISDGRLTRPTAQADEAALRRALGVGVPLHSVALAKNEPKDASIRAVRAAGAAVAHQPLALTLEIGCGGGLDCGKIPVTVRELRSGVEAAVLASGVAEVEGTSATLELKLTLERAGARVVEITIDAPDGDRIPENDQRVMTFIVARDRIRLLHVAGRPTYDVRALRMWLKADESVDLVAFFILRTEHNDTGALDESELALIPFPVHELFTDHLPSFDAVMLQDIDAVTYKFERHLPALANYVSSGGGLIMVGGPSSFVGGSYAGTALDRVLPVTLPEAERPFDTVEFSPEYTAAGRAAPVFGPLRSLLGEELPAMPGNNTLGEARPGSIVLLEHPRRQAGASRMPVLALGEAGDGRAIALGIDGTHALAFGELAARVAGRAYGALWDGLLGWLMRDPRYEAARAELVGECIAGEPVKLRVTRLPGMQGDVALSLERLGTSAGEPLLRKATPLASGAVDFDVGPLAAGGYSARVRIGEAPPTRFDFACEKAGEAWSDSRPDSERLARIATVTGGRSVDAASVKDLPLPEPTQVAAERHVSPILPAWAWTLAAAVMLGGHWVVRRRGGLA